MKVIAEIYERLQRLALIRWDMLIFSQKVQLLFELSQKEVLAPWFVRDPKVVKFIEGVDLEALVSRNTLDFFNVGHLLTSK